MTSDDRALVDRFADALAAIASHLDLVRLARWIWVKMSGLNAILWTQTELTPPAPITRTVDMGEISEAGQWECFRFLRAL